MSNYTEIFERNCTRNAFEQYCFDSCSYNYSNMYFCLEENLVRKFFGSIHFKPEVSHLLKTTPNFSL